MSTTYQLDARDSRFTVQVFATGLLASFGHSPVIAIRDFTGRLVLDPEHPENCALDITVQPKSLEVTGDVKKTDRDEIERQMREDVLEVNRFPTIAFHCTQVSGDLRSGATSDLQFAGQLSLHGVSREQRVNAQVTVRKDELRLAGAFSLLSSDYQIRRVSALAGAIKVKDELKFAFDIAGYPE